MELKPNMYVRTEYGIAKIIQNNFKDEDMNTVLVVDKTLENGYVGSCDELLCSINDVSKANYNIDEVLEVGDIAIMIAYGLPIFKQIGESDLLEIKIGNYQVYKVLTKEQFESMSYKVEV